MYRIVYRVVTQNVGKEREPKVDGSSEDKEDAWRRGHHT